MKKVKGKLLLLALIIFSVALLSGIIGFGGNKSVASADSTYDYRDHSDIGEYAFYFEKFNVTFDVKSNREITVTEELTVNFTGYGVTGFMRDIPVNGGELVRDLSVSEIINGAETDVQYSVTSYTDDYNVNYVTADIGDYSLKKGTVHTYRLKYKYCLTKAQEEKNNAQEGKNELAINAIGVQSRRVESAEIKFILPDGFVSGSYALGSMLAENSTPVKINQANEIVVSDISLAYYEGITFDFTFEDGALSTYFDFTPYYFVIAAAAVLLIVIAMKFIVFSKDKVVPVVNFEAPEQMDPLMMGKLIDLKIDNEDITSMLFYWADKGYLKIDLTNETDPTLIRIVQQLPDGTPKYEKDLYAGLFGKNDVVKTSSLKYKFYRTIDKVSSQVNALVKNCYTKSSVIAAVLFAILSALVCGLAPLFLAMTLINTAFTPAIQIVISLFSTVFFLLFSFSIRAFIQKKEKGKIAMFVLLLALITLFFGVMYCFIIPSGIFPLHVGIILIVMHAVTASSVQILVSKTPQYTEKLNRIVGFRDFITLVEKDKLEQMLETNPQYYYHVLPYAQVLGVSDKWEAKFADITIAPPQWSTTDSVVRFAVINSMIRSSMRNMSQNMGSRPQSSGGSGRGGFGGGHVGGGHGGGGSRGR